MEKQTGCSEKYPVCLLISDILPNNPRNQPNRYIPILINPGDNEADFILLPGHPVIVAAVGYGIDTDV